MIEQTLCEQIKRRVMARIYAIYILRQTTSPLCLKTMALGGGLALGLLWFSWEQIFLNMFPVVSGPISFLVYSWSTFLHTEFPVQFIIVASTGMILWIAWGILPTASATISAAVYKPLHLFRKKVV